MLPVAVAKYLNCLCHPEKNMGVKIPVQVNNIPSHNSIVARTVRHEAIEVVTGTALEIGLFPGHSRSDPLDTLDLVSAHTMLQTINGVQYLVGPIQTATAACCIGYKSPVALGTGTVVDTSGVSVTALTPSPLPYQATLAAGHHSRWRLVSMQVTLKNKTQDLKKGGVVYSVQTAGAFQASSATARSEFEVFESFREHRSNDYIVLTWMPRPQDLAFWHCEGSPTTSTEEAGIRIWIEGPNGTAPADDQYWEMVVVQNWELAGTSLAAVATPAVSHPKAAPVIKPVLETMHNSMPSAKHGVELGRLFHAAFDKGAELGERAWLAVKHAGKEAERHPLIAAGAVGAAAIAPYLVPEEIAGAASATLGESSLTEPLLGTRAAAPVA